MGQLAADGQTKPRPAMAPLDAVIKLGKAVKNARAVGGGNARPGIGDGDPQPMAAALCVQRMRRHGDIDMPLCCQFDRIVCQICDNLRQPRRVQHILCIQCGIEGQVNRNVLVSEMDVGLRGVLPLLGKRAQISRGQRDPDRLGFQPRHIKRVGHLIQQLMRGLGGHFGIMALLRGHLFVVLDQMQQAQDGVQRRAYFVADRREEFRPDRQGGAGLVLGLRTLGNFCSEAGQGVAGPVLRRGNGLDNLVQIIAKQGRAPGQHEWGFVLHRGRVVHMLHDPAHVTGHHAVDHIKQEQRAHIGLAQI
mmetsp:Transcript_27827/g.51905  ORF Transcript_27827/g.51905 Transcript_27827/m.51905 type:complete len:305 (-) Transcript_27827:1255-2169(-)